MQFGNYSLMTLAQARAQANEIQLKLLAGKDPKAGKLALLEAKRRKKELSEQEQRTFAYVADLWIKSERKGNKWNKWKNDPTGEKHAETNLRLHILPVLGDRLIKNITWRDVYEVHTHEELYKKHSQVARKCRAILPSLRRMRIAASGTSNNPLSPKKGSIWLICNQVSWMHQILRFSIVDLFKKGKTER